MPQNDLQQFLLQKKEKLSSSTIDWKAKKDAWIGSIKDFYSRITEHYLKGLVGKTVHVSYRKKRVTEDYIGEYTVQELVLKVADEKVIFSPKGTNIVGASGRIDVRGDLAEVTIIQKPEGWMVVERRPPSLKLVPLDEKSLLAVLKAVMRQ